MRNMGYVDITILIQDFSHQTLTSPAFDMRNSPAIIGVNTAMPGSALAGRAF